MYLDDFELGNGFDSSNSKEYFEIEDALELEDSFGDGYWEGFGDRFGDGEGAGFWRDDGPDDESSKTKEDFKYLRYRI